MAGEIRLSEIGPGFVDALVAWADFKVNEAAIGAGRIVNVGMVQKAGVARLYLAKLGFRVPLRPITQAEATGLHSIISFRTRIHDAYRQLKLDPNSVAAVGQRHAFVTAQDPNLRAVQTGEAGAIEYLRSALMFDEGVSEGQQFASWPNVIEMTASDLATPTLPSTDFTAPSLDQVVVNLEREQAAAAQGGRGARYSSTSLMSVNTAGGQTLTMLRPDAELDMPIYDSLAHLQVISDHVPTAYVAAPPLAGQQAGPAGDPNLIPVDFPPPPPPFEDPAEEGVEPGVL